MLKRFAGIVLVFTVTLAGACKGDEAKPDKAKAAEADKAKAEADKAKAEAPKAEAPKPADPAAAAGGIAGLDKHAFTAGGSLDGVANFGFGGGEGDARAACEQYGKDVGNFLGELSSEYKTLEDTMDTRGADALDRFGQFLVKGAGALKGVKVANGDLSAAHGMFVGGIEQMGVGFNEAAASVRAKDEAGTSKALEKVQSGADATKGAFAKMSTICGG